MSVERGQTDLCRPRLTWDKSDQNLWEGISSPLWIFQGAHMIMSDHMSMCCTPRLAPMVNMSPRCSGGCKRSTHWPWGPDIGRSVVDVTGWLKVGWWHSQPLGVITKWPFVYYGLLLTIGHSSTKSPVTLRPASPKWFSHSITGRSDKKNLDRVVIFDWLSPQSTACNRRHEYRAMLSAGVFFKAERLEAWYI